MVTRRHFLRLVAASSLLSAAMPLDTLCAQGEGDPGPEGDEQTPQPTREPPSAQPPAAAPAVQTGPPRVRQWDRRPKYDPQNTVVGTFDSNDQNPLPTFSVDGFAAKISDGKYYLTKPESRYAALAKIGDYSRFNAAVDVIILDADPKDYVGFQVGLQGVVIKYLLRPKTHEIYLVAQNITGDEGSGWNLKFSFDFIRFPKEYYDISSAVQRLQLVWYDGNLFPLVNNQQVYNGTLYPEPYRVDEVNGPAPVSLIAFGNPDHSFTGVFDNLYFEGSSL